MRSVPLGLLAANVLLLSVGCAQDSVSVQQASSEHGWQAFTTHLDEPPWVKFDIEALPLQPPLLSSLEPDDVVTITLDSSGCFHLYEYSLELRGPSPPLAIVTLMPSPVTGEPLRLTTDQVRRLDLAIAFYRQLGDETGMCTTTERTTVDWRGARVDLVESFVDGTCVLGYSSSQILSPMSLVWDLTNEP